MNVQEIVAKEGIGDLIDGGRHGKVYRVGNTNLAIKIHKLLGVDSKLHAYLQLGKEDRIARRLYENRVSVPKPEGVFGIKDPETNEFVPCYAMEYIPSKKIRWRDKIRASIGYNRGIEKVKRLGFQPHDSDSNSNRIWNGERVYLIDFIDWVEPQLR